MTSAGFSQCRLPSLDCLRFPVTSTSEIKDRVGISLIEELTENKYLAVSAASPVSSRISLRRVCSAVSPAWMIPPGRPNPARYVRSRRRMFSPSFIIPAQETTGGNSTRKMLARSLEMSRTKPMRYL
mgnify:FL=1